MAQLTFPVTKSGLAVPVWIGLNRDMTNALFAAGQQPIPPVQARGLLDTGTDVTAVAGWILQQLGIPVAFTTSTHTAAGNVTGITDPGKPVRTWLTQGTILVTELAALLPDTDVLIGLDFLLEYKLLLDGPGRQFTLEF
jgi:hypothetical protein